MRKHSSSPRSNASMICPELLLAIFKQVDAPTLRSLALVSRAFRNLSEPFLYADIDIHDALAFAIFRQAVNRYGGYRARYVMRFRLNAALVTSKDERSPMSPKGLRTLLAKLINVVSFSLCLSPTCLMGSFRLPCLMFSCLKHIEVSSLALLEEASCLSSITHLRITNPRYVPSRAARRTISLLHSLQTLSYTSRLCSPVRVKLNQDYRKGPRVLDSKPLNGSGGRVELYEIAYRLLGDVGGFTTN
ncbi:hypothetical protein ONZ45_g13162 [Pleurotus djamor]|nr:hypothetical protein ONZ45_g13162 [Pleurotus djamor]